MHSTYRVHVDNWVTKKGALIYCEKNICDYKYMYHYPEIKVIFNFYYSAQTSSIKRTMNTCMQWVHVRCSDSDREKSQALVENTMQKSLLRSRVHRMSYYSVREVSSGKSRNALGKSSHWPASLRGGLFSFQATRSLHSRLCFSRTKSLGLVGSRARPPKRRGRDGRRR